MYESEILEVYRFSKITSFPVDCGKIASAIGYKIMSYQDKAENKEQLMEMLKMSNDAYVVGKDKIIYYNAAVKNERRIRFSIAHELGHIIMMENENEDVANNFASNLLVPRPIVFAEKLHTADEISKYFNVSIAAANNVVVGMRKQKDYLKAYEMIDYFHMRWKCPDIFPIHPVQKEAPKATRTLITELQSKDKEKEDKERYRKQVRSLQGKIKHARLRMVEATDEETYRKYQKKVWDCEKHLDLIQGKKPFEEKYMMEDLANSVIYGQER